MRNLDLTRIKIMLSTYIFMVIFLIFGLIEINDEITIGPINAIFILGILFCVGMFVLWLFKYIKYKSKLRLIKINFSNQISISISDFRLLSSNSQTFAGIYVLLNKTKGINYVGQSRDVYGRVKQHTTGYGNGNVYADMKYGDIFAVKLLPLKNSGFNSLNELEKFAIDAFDAYKHGYNRTSGNR